MIKVTAIILLATIAASQPFFNPQPTQQENPVHDLGMETLNQIENLILQNAMSNEQFGFGPSPSDIEKDWIGLQALKYINQNGIPSANEFSEFKQDDEFLQCVLDNYINPLSDFLKNYNPNMNNNNFNEFNVEAQPQSNARTQYYAAAIQDLLPILTNQIQQAIDMEEVSFNQTQFIQTLMFLRKQYGLIKNQKVPPIITPPVNHNNPHWKQIQQLTQEIQKDQKDIQNLETVSSYITSEMVNDQNEKQDLSMLNLLRRTKDQLKNLQSQVKSLQQEIQNLNNQPVEQPEFNGFPEQNPFGQPEQNQFGQPENMQSEGPMFPIGPGPQQQRGQNSGFVFMDFPAFGHGGKGSWLPPGQRRKDRRNHPMEFEQFPENNGGRNSRWPNSNNWEFPQQEEFNHQPQPNNNNRNPQNWHWQGSNVNQLNNYPCFTPQYGFNNNNFPQNNGFPNNNEFPMNNFNENEMMFEKPPTQRGNLRQRFPGKKNIVV